MFFIFIKINENKYTNTQIKIINRNDFLTAQIDSLEILQLGKESTLNNVEAEKSIGATFDINYKGEFVEDLKVSVNQLFFLSKIEEFLIRLLMKLNFGRVGLTMTSHRRMPETAHSISTI